MITAYLLSLFVRKQADWAALLSLAVAINCRPNAAVFIFALPVLLGFRRSIKPAVLILCAAAAIGGLSYVVVHHVYPDYSASTFLAGLRQYELYYVVGALGDGGNSSLLGMFKSYYGIYNSYSGVVQLVALAILMIALGKLVLRNSESGTCLMLLYFPFLYVLTVFFSSGGLSALIGNWIGSALLILVSAWGLWKSEYRMIIAPFIFTALYCLLCPIFAEYHLLVFVAPLLVVYFQDFEARRQREILYAVGLCSVAMLAPKNYIYFQSYWDSDVFLSLQTVINPLLLYCGIFYLIRDTFPVRTSPRVKAKAAASAQA